MFKLLKEKFAKIVYPSLIVVVIILIFHANYVPNTFLIGWDSLQTELNPWLGVKRALFSVWQEYQGFGLTSGMAHASDLLRALSVWFMSIFIPADLIRYVFHHLMLLLGGLGIFELIKYLMGDKKEKNFLAFIGALFYILNFGTAQIFSVPFEPFSIFFAALPWELLVFFNYLAKPSKKQVISLVLINILSTPQAYLQTLFVVYFIILFSLSFGYVVKDFSLQKVKRVLFGLGLVLIVNAFWILPQIYFLKTSLNIVESSKINQVTTEPTYYRNIEKGRFKYFSRFEGFYYDLFDVSGNELFGPWKEHFSIGPIYYLSFLPFVFILLGVAFGKCKHKLGLIFSFVLLLFVFLNSTMPISLIHDFVRSIPLVSQVFRSPFTKFIIPLSLVGSILFTLGIDTLLNFLAKKEFSDRKVLSVSCGLLFVVVITLISLPVFKGNLFLPQMKMSIPDTYFKVFDYFSNEDKNKRIALLPDYTYWGWFKTKWGYDGSGFLWYGIEQPLVSRTFDVWSNESESYFWEIKDAIESQDVSDFEEVLRKYDVDYLLVDYTLEPVAAQKAGLQYDQIANIVRLSSKLRLEKSFDGVSIFSFEDGVESSISAFVNIASAGPNVEVTDFDNAFSDLKDYYSGGLDYDYYYPFLGLSTQNSGYKQNYSLYEDEEHFVLEVPLSLDPNEYELEVPNNISRAKVFDGETINYYDFKVAHEVLKDKLIIKVDKEYLETVDLGNIKVENCLNSVGSFSTELRGSVLYVNSKDRATACFGYGRPFLALWNSYLVKVKSSNSEGRPLFFYIVGGKSRDQSKVETYLNESTNYFILKPGYYYDDGYSFGFQNISYENVDSTNLVEELSIYLFPYDYLKGTRFVKKDVASKDPEELDVEVRKLSYANYVVKEGFSESGILVLHQSFDPGWVALCGFKKCDVEHVEVNNWANGWVFEGAIPSNVRIVFWPQCLQYLGYLVFIMCFYIAVTIKSGTRGGNENETSHSIDKN